MGDASLPSRRQQRSSDARRSDVLTAARRLFAEKGFHATSTRELAAAADINEALLCRCFESKDAILAALIDEAITAFTTLPRPSAEEAQTLPIAQLLERIGNAFVQTATGQLDLLTILISEHQQLADDPRFLAFIHFSAVGLGGQLNQRTGRDDGYLTARAFMGSLVAFVLLQDVLGMSAINPVDAEQYVRHLAQLTAAEIDPHSSSGSGSGGGERRQ